MTRQVLLTITADIDAVDIHRRIAHAFADVAGECRVSIRNTVGEVEAMVDAKRLKVRYSSPSSEMYLKPIKREVCARYPACVHFQAGKPCPQITLAPDQPGDKFTKAADCE